MQVLRHNSAEFMLFARKSALILRLLGGLLGFEGEVGHGADEIVQAEITLRGLGCLVYRSLRVGTCAACAWQLGAVTFAVVGKQGLGFLFGEELWTLRKDRDGRCLFGLIGIENLLCEPARLAEHIKMSQLGSLRRILLVVTRIADGIGFLPAMPYLLAFAAGTHSNLSTIGFALGFVLMMVLDVVAM